ncbi:gastrula zinc finger protein XlCGF26.1-like [Calliphora vicina]|uniref:gastrula zinc finger protein XlCGF26.1-like n=1 Tax=Calliphora vicina TaxID=7373 RepID=UPI00325BF09F
MKNLSYETVQSFCRACLKELKNRQKCKIISLNLQIRHWLEDATLDNPLASDIYPNSICHSCRNKLKEFSEFHEMCKESRKTIQKMLPNEEVTKLQVNQINNIEDPELEENMLAYDILASHEENSALAEHSCSIVDTEHCIIDPEEPLKSSASLNGTETKSDNSADDDDSDIEELKKHNSSDDDPVESEEIHSDFETDIPKNNKLATKIKSNFSKSKRKKYTYSFRCDQCKYRCVSQQTLDIHIRTHYGLKPYQCPKCEDAFDKSTFLLKHLNEIHGEKELIIICEHEECGQQFTSSRSYKDHYRQNHILQQSREKQDKSTAKTPYRHVCEECGKIFAKLHTLKEHQYRHGPKELYPFQCNECDKAFVGQRTLHEHMLRHAGIKNFECPHCGAKKTTKKELRSHMNSHTKERQYPCPNCPMIFYRSSNRRIHIDVVHQGIRRFACRFCDQTFGKGDNLKNHELIHTGEKPHACTECGKRFVQRVSLRSHMKTHNK